MKELHPVILKLLALIEENKWRERFSSAIESVKQKNIDILKEVQDFDSYIQWINDLLYWKPSENKQGSFIRSRQNGFYFILDQPPLLELQNRIEPHAEQPERTVFSNWIYDYVQALGRFLESPESIDAETLQSFKDSPGFNWDEYLPPPSGYQTFNQFFARQEKSGTRPIAAIADHSVIVQSADSIFQGWWQINENSKITVKDIQWSIEELLDGSPYRDRFKGGIFMHGWLNITDSHRLIAPVAGRVVEARVIMGQVYRDIQAEPVPGSTTGEHVLAVTDRQRFASEPSYQLTLNSTPGYQFAQERALIILDSPIGLVAVLPVGMGFVSSVVLSTEVGKVLNKGEEICYVQFGGSDHIILFEAASCVNLTAQLDVHYQKGQVLGYAHPVLS